MIYKKATNGEEQEENSQQQQSHHHHSHKKHNSNFRSNSKDRYTNRHQMNPNSYPNQGFSQQPQQPQMGTNGFLGIVKTSASKARYYKPQYPQQGLPGIPPQNPNYHHSFNGNPQSYPGYPPQQQFNNTPQQGNFGGYHPPQQAGRPQPVPNRPFHPNFNNHVGVNKHQLFNHQSNAVNQNQR